MTVMPVSEFGAAVLAAWEEDATTEQGEARARFARAFAATTPSAAVDDGFEDPNPFGTADSALAGSYADGRPVAVEPGAEQVPGMPGLREPAYGVAP